MRFGEPIEAKTIFEFVDFFEELSFQFLKRHLVDAAFKDRLLDALANSLADFCYTAKTSSSLGRLGRYVVAN